MKMTLDDEWNRIIERLCANHDLVIIVKSNNGGYSVYFDSRHNYDIMAKHYNASTPLEAIEKAYEETELPF